MFETHLKVFLHNGVRTPCTFLSLELVYTLFGSSIDLLRMLLRAFGSCPPWGRSIDWKSWRMLAASNSTGSYADEPTWTLCILSKGFRHELRECS